MYHTNRILPRMSRQTRRMLHRGLYLLIACALGSILTLCLRPASNVTAFDMAFSAFYHEDGVPLDVKSPRYPEIFLRSVLPIPCHSHNDEWRHTPLHAALGSGCISVEADVMAATEQGVDGLYVAHGPAALRRNRTLSSMYLEPLMDILELINTPENGMREQESAVDGEPIGPKGVFALSPLTSLTLLLDFKSPASQIWPLLDVALEPLIARDYLTRWEPATQSRIERPITIVASGIADFETILHAGPANTNGNSSDKDQLDPLLIERRVFFDAPLDALVRPGDPDSAVRLPVTAEADNFARSNQHTDEEEQTRKRTAQGVLRYTYNPSNSHLASTSFSQAVGAISPFLSYPDSLQRKVVREQIRAAKDRGLISRYWDTPRWPKGLRDGVWENLEKEGVGLLSVDDLRGVRVGDWGRRSGGRWWGTVSRGQRRAGTDGTGWLPEY